MLFDNGKERDVEMCLGKGMHVYSTCAMLICVYHNHDQFENHANNLCYHRRHQLCGNRLFGVHAHEYTPKCVRNVFRIAVYDQDAYPSFFVMDLDLLLSLHPIFCR